MSKTEFVDYELMTKFFDGKMQVAIPRENLPETLQSPVWLLNDTTLVVKHSGTEEHFLNVPGPMRDAIMETGALHYIDLDREKVILIPKSFAFFASL
jgi:hypothetical protein